jgi:hypothetical protein
MLVTMSLALTPMAPAYPVDAGVVPYDNTHR